MQVLEKLTPESISDDLVVDLFETRRDEWFLHEDETWCEIRYEHEGITYRIVATVHHDWDCWGDFWNPLDIVEIEVAA